VLGHEYLRHLTGSGRFTDDLKLEELAYGHVLRSPHAHAELGKIDTAAAEEQPGVIAVFTGRDLQRAGVGSIPCLYTLEQMDGSPMATPPRRPLALDRVRHLGDAVAFVVGESPAIAADAAERIEVEYSPLPSITDANLAALSGAPLVWPEVPDNVCFRWESGDARATEAALANAARVVRRDVIFPRIIVNTLEPRAAVGVLEADTLILTTQSQGTHLLRDQLADVLACSQDELHVVTPDVGGSFGMKAYLYPEHILVAHAARSLGRPVKWTSGRSSGGFLGDNQARDQIFDVELGLDERGRFVALRMRTLANLGAYLSNYAPSNSTVTSAITGPYAIPAAHVETIGVFTNTVPIDSYRGAGRAEAVYPVERIVDAAALELAMDPAELRRKNFATFAGGSRTNCMGLGIQGRDYDHCLNRALARSDWEQRGTRREEARSRGRLRGIGLACYATTAMGQEECVRLEVDAEGVVSVLVGTQSSGQGHETVFAQVVAESLSIEADRVGVVQGDTRRIKTGLMTGGSRSISTVVPACEQAARAWIDRGREVAAALMQTKPERIAYVGGVFRSEETAAQLSLGELVSAAAKARLLEDGITPCLAVERCHDPGKLTHPSGCHVCELEIDPDSGEVDLLRYTSIDDVGRVQNPALARAQVHGAVAQGFGQAVLEACHYDAETGQLLSGSLLDYALPRADNLPFFEPGFGQEDDGAPLRGLGEMGTIAATPAIVNALIDALAQIGVGDIDIPATPERVWRACRPATATTAAGR
jgi:carbon-monoxide dehydrogenase large subunit